MSSAVQNSSALRVVALAGNPNCGKTTLFNGLTGLRQKVANYPGVTVEKKTGRCVLDDNRSITLLDLPGTYSLVAQSPDEMVAMEVLRGLRPDTPPPDALIAVIDASNLARNLLLFSQLSELRIPLIIALTMTDVAEGRQQRVNIKRLQDVLGVPVIPVIGHKQVGIEQLKTALDHAAIPTTTSWELPATERNSIAAVAELLGDEKSPHQQARRLLAGENDRHLQALLAQTRIAEALRMHAPDPAIIMQADIEARYRWIDGIVAQVVDASGFKPGVSRTEKIDAVFVHPIFGLGIFAGIMASLFISIFLLADPLMGYCEELIAAIGGWVTGEMSEGMLKSLLNDGVFGGVGGVVVFVPQIAILFLFLALLEDSGYLARAAFLMDKLLAKVGLHGRSFIPLLSSFACAIPGIMATRTIENPRERLSTILVAPFMSCSARLPVYGLLIGAFFGDALFAGTTYENYTGLIQGGIMLGCYVLGILAAVVTSYFSMLFLGRGAVTPFILELPNYQWPQFGQVVRHMWHNTAQFLTKAGSIIFCLSIVLWAMAYFPRLSDERTQAITEHVTARTAPLAMNASDDEIKAHNTTLQAHINETLASEQLENSISGKLGHAIEPVIAPLGYDWKIGVGVIAAFAAREVFVSNLAIVYRAGDSEDDIKPLEDAIRADTYDDGRPVWRPLVAASLLVWFVLAMQCISTTAIVRRETGGWKWPLIQLAYMNALAYSAALLTYQIGSRFFGW
jgi:ferrous iron transport protein B